MGLETRIPISTNAKTKDGVMNLRRASSSETNQSE